MTKPLQNKRIDEQNRKKNNLKFSSDNDNLSARGLAWKMINVMNVMNNKKSVMMS